MRLSSVFSQVEKIKNMTGIIIFYETIRYIHEYILISDKNMTDLEKLGFA